ncbi:MAG: DUF1844 domain-containing protein [Planctomycetes bacterium]|nr:DUF1844 domain-containing protein [Planctomycetota bacterium]
MEEKSDSTKQIDDAWKQQVQKEQVESSSKDKQEAYTKPTFYDVIAMYTMQSLFFLGMLKDPNNPDFESKVDLQSAKLNIDILSLLQDKSKGNLTEEENVYLTNTLNELRVLYIKRADDTKGKSPIITT